MISSLCVYLFVCVFVGALLAGCTDSVFASARFCLVPFFRSFAGCGFLFPFCFSRDAVYDPPGNDSLHLNPEPYPFSAGPLRGACFAPIARTFSCSPAKIQEPISRAAQVHIKSEISLRGIDYPARRCGGALLHKTR